MFFTWHTEQSHGFNPSRPHKTGVSAKDELDAFRVFTQRLADIGVELAEQEEEDA